MTRRRTRPERCQEWPACRCQRRWQFWQAFNPYTEIPWTDEEYEWAFIDMIWMLACVATNCPVPDLRYHAMLQLMREPFVSEARKWLH
jgi:hypothetical protein